MNHILAVKFEIKKKVNVLRICKYILRVLVGMLIIFLWFVLLLLLFNKPKSPISTEYAGELLSADGYTVTNLTDDALQKNPNWDLVGVLSAVKGSIRFEFYEFKSKESAVDIYGQAYSDIMSMLVDVPRIDTDTSIANYRIFTLRDQSQFAVSIYVENTAVYAYCDKADSTVLVKLLMRMGYYDE